MKTNKLIVIAGPTAIGKTKLAVSIAKMYKTDIISADSRQMFKELCIGVDKPSKKQLSQINHHFVNYISITDDYSVGKYEKDCKILLTKFKDNIFAWLSAEKADFGISPASIESPTTYISLKFCN